MQICFLFWISRRGAGFPAAVQCSTSGWFRTLQNAASWSRRYSEQTELSCVCGLSFPVVPPGDRVCWLPSKRFPACHLTLPGSFSVSCLRLQWSTFSYCWFVSLPNKLYFSIELASPYCVWVVFAPFPDKLFFFFNQYFCKYTRLPSVIMLNVCRKYLTRILQYSVLRMKLVAWEQKQSV